MAQIEDNGLAAPTEGQRLTPSQANGTGETPLRVLSTPEALLRLWRTCGVWQVPELDPQGAEALVELWPLGSFLVIGHDPRQVLVLKTGPSVGEVNTYQIQKFPGGVSLESSNLCMPDLPHLLAFLSASRDVLPRTLLLPPPTLRQGDEHSGPLQINRVQLDPSGGVLSVVNQLYLETHRDWEMEQTPQEKEPETAQGLSPGPAVEEAVCRAVLAPLKPALWRRLRTLRAQELRRLRRRQIALRAEAGPPGAQGAEPEGQSPAPALRSRIHARLANLHAACAPRRKIALLLAVCSDVYAGLVSGENQEPQGADAFLPALTEELIWSPDIGETQLDVEFLMELLDPDELRGEAGYYLTTWFGALYHIAHYEPDAGRAPQGLSSEARASLRQWHRRRTLHGQDHPGAQVQTGRPWNGHGGSRQPPWLGLVTLMAGRAALSTMASRFLEETSWTIPVRLIAHQHFQLLDVVDQELPEATGQQVLRFLVTAVTDAGHQDLALESSSAPCCQSLWVSASCA
ncbi:ras and Rab interactor-like protein isoform X5 [Tupaia chinensis]|uniref:ras and Rab interactor-like protein isoform X5 n=1 Tax=Tupaia chinensis TaxID=246437 RepID=UPI000FFC908E|nr:ras and Rab interactor-like protein isoform X5 [Tupaia chinensis]